MKKIILFYLLLISISYNLSSQTIIDNVSSTALLSTNKVLNQKIIDVINKLDLQNSVSIESSEITNYKNSEIISITIPFINSSEEYIVIYYYNDKTSVCKANITTDKKTNIQTFKITNFEGKQYFSIQKNQNNQIGGFVFTNNIIKDDLATNVDERMASPSCPKQFPHDFSACMDCAVQECSSSWLCTLACALGGTISVVACFAGFGLACGGVGTPH